MKEPSFENDLFQERYNRLAKINTDPNTIEETYNDIERELEELFQEMIDSERDTDPSSEERMYELQKQKQALLDELHRKLRIIDTPEQHLKRHRWDILVIAEGEQLFILDEATNTKSPITYEELLADKERGMRYYLDPESVPNSLQKGYLVAEIRQKIFDLFDNTL